MSAVHMEKTAWRGCRFIQLIISNTHRLHHVFNNRTESSNALSRLDSVVQVQLEDTKKAREDAYEKYVASRLGSAVFAPAANIILFLTLET